ncbi:MAG: hypothetical protein MI674_04735 [Cytophagales bacterium]|nr:hypothetical protein [Cytophagales bacterium]
MCINKMTTGSCRSSQGAHQRKASVDEKANVVKHPYAGQLIKITKQ